ncbi:hypothetical protein ABZS76_33140 [Streptomyces sp. NPDC005562]|uniref:hypothetical protein n=1 Tax=Streptomyces sp. NPDC005562 TaxID=3154890 RepID=UPI0033A94ACC
MSRPLMAALAAQQQVIDDQRRELAVQGQQISLIARLAGVSKEVAAIAKTADIANPAQPIPDPGEQAPSETTEQAATPETNDDVRSPGQTGNSTAGVPAETTDTALTPGGTIPAEPYGNLQDVTSPVSGTNTGEVGGDQTRIESDVRVGNPMQPEVAFPWTISDNQSNSAPPRDGEMSQTGGSAPSPSRTHACLRLARLQLQAGVARGDDLTLAASIEADAQMGDALIAHEIAVLSGVVKSASKAPSGAPRVPVRTQARVAPSLASQSSVSGGGEALDDSDIFLS